MINAINDNLHFIHHLGHSNNTMIWKMRVSSGDVDACTNTGYFIGYTQGCHPGAWDNRSISHNGSINSGHSSSDCIAEEFTVGSSHGAIGFISNTRFSLTDNVEASPDGSDGANTRLQRYFLNALFELKLHYIAMMHCYSKEINKQLILDDEPGPDNLPYWGGLRCATYDATLLGDPALSVWTDTPLELKPTYTLDGTVFNCDTKNPYTWVALEDKDSNIIITQLTADDGICKIDDQILTDYITANTGTKMTVRMKAHNHLPFEGELDVQTVIASSPGDMHRLKVTTGVSDMTMMIRYTLTERVPVTISLLNAKEVAVANIVDGIRKPGNHHHTFNTDNISNGMYYCRLQIGSKQCVTKCMAVK